ncbi:pyrroloquinoline quinone-dependent dehydrogenase [Bryobacter aggregatus]|uniref:pyrroloquinoline quinone-dependent dehydrogenase n=1 Tax=Bryobacter aggregatus TaxID=360054 RepID=UPI0004E25354|nr:pyrroloquinoline quinone-dependent dehydrogenase [Bryobacter aggregatus]
MRTFLLLSLLVTNAWCQYSSWPAFGGGPGNTHYSSLKQINKSNASKLKVAWTYDAGDASRDSDIQANPIMVGGVIYTTTAKLKVIALDAGTGKLIWSFDGWDGKRPNHKNRGVTHWTDGKQARIFVPLGLKLYSLDARTGKPDPAFGQGGSIDMRLAFEDRPIESVQLSVSTPGVIYRDLIILGSSVAENLPATPGDIRAYNVRTGALAWTFHTIPKPGEPGSETWPADARKNSGGANNWAGLVVDQKRGTVFVPTGSAAFDFYGADRHGDNLYANTILCLDAATGQRKWHFQAVKHDAWDLDFPQAPVLVTIRKDGKWIDAVAQAGKDGYLYLLNRDTGESIYPLQEIQVPASRVEGELLATTQRIPTKPAPFSRQEFTADMATTRTELAHKAVVERLKNLDYGGRFTPPSTRGTVVFPGFSGGAEWGGSAFDPTTNIFYINANEMPWVLRLVPTRVTKKVDTARRLYMSRCASCHRDDQKGAPPEYPAVDNLNGKYTAEQLIDFLRKGSGRMPGFANLGDPALEAITNLLLKQEDRESEIASAGAAAPRLKYTMDGYNKFLDPDGYPAVTPPWGTLNAINLNTGEYVWKIPFGEYPELVAQGYPNTGAENHGGGIVTAGGLFFIAASAHDRKFRVFDKMTGKLLWETLLPQGGNATPATYMHKGKQYIVVPAGGGRGRESGGSFVAYSLP